MSCEIKYNGQSIPLGIFSQAVASEVANFNSFTDYSVEVEDNSSTSSVFNPSSDLKNKEFSMEGVNLHKDYTFIKGVPTAIQFNVINYITNNIVNHALENLDNVVKTDIAVDDTLNQLYNRRNVIANSNIANKDKFTKILDTIIGERELIIERVNTIIAKNSPIKVASKLDIKLSEERIAEQEGNANEEIEEYVPVDDIFAVEEVDNSTGVEDTESTTNYDDSAVFKANPTRKLSEKNRAILKKVRIGKVALDSNNKPILDEKGFYTLAPTFNPLTGLDEYVPMEQIYSTLVSLLSTTNQQYIPSNFDSYVSILKSHVRSKPYLIDVITMLESMSESQKSAFVSNFSNQFTHSNFINIIHNEEEGVTEYRITNSDQRDNANSLINTWTNNLVMNDSLTKIEDTLQYKESVKERMNKQLEYLAHPNTDITLEHINTFFHSFGINITAPVFEALKIHGFRGQTLKSAFDANVNGGFAIMAATVNRNKDMQNNTIFNDGIFSSFAKFVAEYSEVTSVSSFRSIKGDMHFAYTNPRNIITAIGKVKNDEQRINDIIKSPFANTTPSIVNSATLPGLSWLNNMVKVASNPENDTVHYTFNRDSIYHSKLTYNSPEGIKNETGKAKSPDKMSPADYESFKFNTFLNNGDVASNTPIYSFIGLTMSDKKNPITIKAPGKQVFLLDSFGVPTIKQDVINNDVLIVKGDDTIMFETMVYPEIKRMLTHRKMKVNGMSTTVHGFDEGGNRFYIFPELNNIDYLFDTTYDEHGMIVSRFIKPNILSDSKALVFIKEQIRESLLNEVHEKIEEWVENGILTTDFDSYRLSGISALVPQYGTYKDLLSHIFNYTYNYRIANFNMQQLFIGDPALYYLDKGLRGIKREITKYKEKEKPVEADKQKLAEAIAAYNQEYKTGVVKESFDNQGKRLAADNASGTEVITEKPDFRLLILPDAEKDSSILPYLKHLLGDAETKNYKGINTADAQEYVTLQEHLVWLLSEDKISKETMEELMELYNNDDYIDWKAFEERGVVLAPRKPVYSANFTRTDGDMPLYSRFYIKSSAIPLIKGFTKGLPIDKLRKFMEENNVDRAAYESAIKVGLPAKDTYKNGDFIITLPRSGHLVQQEVPYNENKKYINDGTQKSNLMYLNIMDVEGFVDPISGETVNGRKHYEGYAKQYDKLFKHKYNKLVKELEYDPETGSISMQKLSDRLTKEGISRGFSDNELLQFQLNDKGQFRVPLWLSNNDSKIQALLNSIVDNGIRKRKPRGKSYVLVSDNDISATNYMSDITWIGKPVQELMPQRLEAVLDEEGNAIKDEEGNVVGEIKPGQLLVPFDVFDQNGKRLKIEDYLTDNGNGIKVIDTTKLPKDVLEAFGFRIPTQDMGSMHTFEIVGFLPTYMKDMVIAPKELVAQMGSDFDVDKLYNYFFNVVVDPETGVATKITESNYKDLGIKYNTNLYEKVLENNILDYSLAVMRNPSDIVQKQVYTPVDNAEFDKGVKLAAEFSAIYDKGGFNYYKESFQTYKYSNAVSGKDAVGSFALDTVFNAVAQTTENSLKHYRVDREGEIVYLTPEVFTNSGNNINDPKTLDGVTNKSDVIKAFLSMAVDNEKLQVLGILGINNVTMDFIRGAVFGGFSVEEIVTFLNHPVIKKLVKEKLNSKVSYESSLINMSIDKILPQPISLTEAKSRIGEDASYIEDGEALAIYEQFTRTSSLGSVIKSVQVALNSDSSGVGKDIFESSIKQKRIKNLHNVMIENVTDLVGEYRYLVLEPEYMGLDNNGKRRYIADLEAKGYVMIERTFGTDTNGAEIENSLIMIKPTTIKGNAAIRATVFNNTLWNNILPYNRDKFSSIFRILSEGVNHRTREMFLKSTKEEAVFYKKITDEFKSYLFSYNTLLAGGYDSVNEARQDLLLDSEEHQSLASFLHDVKNSNKLNNRLINRLLVKLDNINRDGLLPNSINYNSSSAESIDEDLIVQSIIDLLENNTLELGTRNGNIVTPFTLMKDLINYQLVTGGIQKANQFIKHIPVGYYEQLGLYETSVENFKKLTTIEPFINQFVQHNPQYFVNYSSNEEIGLDTIKDVNISESVHDLKVVAKDSSSPIYVYKTPTVNSPYLVKLDTLGYKGTKEYSFDSRIGVSTVYGNQGDHALINGVFNNKKEISKADYNRHVLGISLSELSPFDLSSKNDTTLRVGSVVTEEGRDEHVIIGIKGTSATILDTVNNVTYVKDLDSVKSYKNYSTSTTLATDYIVTNDGKVISLEDGSISPYEVINNHVRDDAYGTLIAHRQLPDNDNYEGVSQIFTPVTEPDEYDVVIANELTGDLMTDFNILKSSPRDLLQRSANLTTNPITREMLKVMLTKASILDGLPILLDNNLKGRGAVTYDEDLGQITSIRFNINNIKSNEEFASVIAEEVLHVFTKYAADIDPDIDASLTALYEKAKAVIIKTFPEEYKSMERKMALGLPLDRKIEYDFAYSVFNRQEFLSAAITNEKFQKFLNKSKSNSSISFVDALVNFFTKVLKGLGIIEDSMLHHAIHNLVDLTNQIPMNEVKNIKAEFERKGKHFATPQTVYKNLGLKSDTGLFLPIGNPLEVVDFINNKAQNLVAANEGPYVFVDYIGNGLVANKTSFAELDDIVAYTKQRKEIKEKGFEVGSYVTYKGELYIVRGFAKGFDSNHKILLATLDGKPKLGGGIVAKNLALASQEDIDLNGSKSNITIDFAPTVEEAQEFEYNYNTYIDSIIFNNDNDEATSNTDYFSQGNRVNKVMIATIQDRIHDLTTIANNIKAEPFKDIKARKERDARYYKVMEQVNGYRETVKLLYEEISIQGRATRSLTYVFNTAHAELDEVRVLLTKPLTDTHLIYASRIANLWSRTRELMLNDNENKDKGLNKVFLQIEDEAIKVQEEILNVMSKSLEGGMLKETLGRDVNIEDILEHYVPKGYFTAMLSDLTTMDNALLSAAGISIKNANFQAHRELTDMFDGYDQLIIKAHRDMSAMSGKTNNPFDIFMQRRKDGELSNHLVGRYSHEFHKQWSRAKREYMRGKSDISTMIDISDWINNNAESIDIWKVFPPNGVVTDEVNEAREELKRQIGINAYNEFFLAQSKKLERYNLNKEGMEQAILDKYGITSISDIYLKDDKGELINKNAKKEWEKWMKTNSPYMFKNIKSSEIVYPFYNNLDYLEIIPKRSKTEYFDEAFSRIENNTNVHNLYKFMKETYDELFTYLTPDQRRDIAYNGFVEIPATMMELYMTQGAKLGFKPILDAMVDMTRSSEAYTAIDIASGKSEKRMSLGFNRKGTRDIPREIDRRINMYVLEHGETPSDEQVNAWEDELFKMVRDNMTPDLGKALKLYATAVIGFKHKSRIESSLKILDTVIGSKKERLRNSSGETLTINGEVQYKESADVSFVNEKKLYQFTIDKLIYNAPNNRTLGEKSYTQAEKELIESIDKDIEKLKRVMQGKHNSPEEAERFEQFNDYAIHGKQSIPEMIRSLEDYKASLGKQIDYSKVGNMVLQYVQLKGMGWNVIGGISNVLFGAVANLIEGSNGQVYNNKDLLEGYKLAMHSVGRSLFFNNYEGRNQEAIKIRMAMDKLDILKESSSEASNSTYHNPVYNKLKFLLPYNINQRGEYLNQAPLMIAMAKKQQITLEDGRVISLWEGFDSQFNWKTDEFGPEPSAIIQRFGIKVTQLIKTTHGNYDPLSPMMIKKSLAGRAITQFRTWAIDSYRIRFGDRHGRYDEILEITRKGRYISLWDAGKASPGKFALALLTETAKKFIPNIGGLSSTRESFTQIKKLEGIDGVEAVDIANIQAVATEIAMAISIYTMMAVLSALLGDLDDEEEMVYNFYMNQATRLRTDILLYANPLEAKKLIDNPFPVVGLLDDIKGLFVGMGDLVLGQDEYQTGVYVGESKMAHKIPKMIPLGSSTYRIYRATTQLFDK